VESYDWYLKGRYQWHQRTPESLAESVRCFEAALAHDPRSALAHAGLADAYSLLVEYGFLRPKEGMTKAKAAAIRAAELAPELAEAFVSLALIRSHYDHDWPEAGRLYRRAIELNPGCVTAHHWRGVDYYALLGRFDEAFAELEIGGQLDPLSSIIREGVALVHILKRQYDDALAVLKWLAESDPAYYKTYSAMGRVYAQQGRYAEAIAMLEKARALAGDVPNILSAIGQVLGLAGERERACEAIAKLEKLAQSRYVPSTCFAIVNLGLGEIERSLDWLERGYEQGDTPLVGLKMHPLFDPLRGEPRFQALLRRLRFE
jgi:serine/threonine-protein kinase